MNMFEKINACEYLFLNVLTEPEDNCLRVVIEEAKANGPVTTLLDGDVRIKGIRAIEHTDTCATFEIIWPNYVAYAVRNETFTSLDKAEEWNGRLFCIYTKSHFLDFVQRSTFATAEYPGPMKHWGVNCLNHIIDVVSIDEPQILRQAISAIHSK